MKNKQELHGFLSKYNVAHIATISESNKPHVSTIYYYLDQDFNFYFVTKSETRKYNNLVKNSNVSLAITNEKELQTVQLEGMAFELSQAQELTMAVNNISRSSLGEDMTSNDLPISKIKDGSSHFFKIKPSWIRWMAFKDNDSILQFEENFK